jgi:hypothetical protein
MKKNARQNTAETQRKGASAAPTSLSMKPRVKLSGPSKKGRRVSVEAQSGSATSTPAIPDMKSSSPLPGSLNSTVEAIRAHHRERRFAMGIQQVLDRKLESFIRINKTDWHVDDDDAARDKANRDVAAKIKAARDGDGDASIIMVVSLTDRARAPADAERNRHETEMETLARSLPVAPWVETVPGLGYLGLATIIAETGDLSMYSNVAKVWKRLGYAPYDGLAGSSWKRPSWRNGREALTAEEWIAHPFSGRRYALIHTISVWLKNKQWIGAAKSEDGVGKPNGKYGEVYAKRRAHTAETHPDWSKQHSHMDGLRVMMKEVLKDLYLEWNPEKKTAGRHFIIETPSRDATAASPAQSAVKPRAAVPGSPLHENGRQRRHEVQSRVATAEPGQCGLEILGRSAGLTTSRSVALRQLKPTTSMRPEPGHHRGETQIFLAGLTLSQNGRPGCPGAHTSGATASPAKFAAKPRERVPGSPITNTVSH